MSTRGMVGIRKNGVTKGMYNHSDSYPEVLGVNVLEQIRGIDVSKTAEAFGKIILVQEGDEVPQEWRKKYKQYTDGTVGQLEGQQSDLDWYQVLRGLQGNLRPYLSGEVYHMVNGSDFLFNYTFCQWAYVVNLDTNKLEVWRRGPHKIIEFALSKLPTKNEFLSRVKDY